MLWRLSIACLLLYVRGAVGDTRPPNQTVCDYYAEQNYGANNVTTQLRLMQGIVAYAYAGGNTLPRPNENGTGIFNKGKFNDREVFLRSWFDGTKATTNVNGLAVKVDWLDGGGLDPLLAFLNGSTPTAKIRENSNQDILFSHWYVTFGKLYKCSLVSKFVAKEYAPFTPAYVHKYMDLDQTQVAYFIDQLIIASKYYGFSDSDAQQLSASMNTKYNNNCSPPDSAGQLNSVCFAKTCPLAVPESDCGAYSSVGPYGFKASVPTGTASGVVPTVATTATTAASETNTSEATKAASSSSSLSAGAIAGIAIGGAVVILLAIGMWLFFRRQQQAKKVDTPPSTQNQMSQGDSTVYSPQAAYGNPHDSYYGRGPHDSYVVSTIGSPQSPPLLWDQAKSHPPQELATEGHGNNQWGAMHQIAEMESPDPPSGWDQQPRP